MLHFSLTLSLSLVFLFCFCAALFDTSAVFTSPTILQVALPEALK